MGACPGCELLPAAIPTTGQLLLWPPLGHTSQKLKASLSEREIPTCEPAPRCLGVELTPALLLIIREQWTSLLSQAEMNDCKCLVLPPGVALGMEHLAEMQSLDTFLGRLAGRWLVEMMAAGQLETHFQPIVSTADPLEVFAYECLVRGRDTGGQVVYPGALYNAARRSKMLFHLDRAARLQHIRAARAAKLETCIFINFNPTSIYDPAFCLRSTVEAIGNSGIEPARFVFEVVESDDVEDPARLPEILKFYREAGFRVALDDIGAGFSSLNLLSRLKPDFIKLDMELMRGVDLDPYKAQLVSKLLEVAKELDIQTIAEGIETVGEWQWAVEHGADFSQGFLFGKPAATPQLSFTEAVASLA